MIDTNKYKRSTNEVQTAVLIFIFDSLKVERQVHIGKF